MFCFLSLSHAVIHWMLMWYVNAMRLYWRAMDERDNTNVPHQCHMPQSSNVALTCVTIIFFEQRLKWPWWLFVGWCLTRWWLWLIFNQLSLDIFHLLQHLFLRYYHDIYFCGSRMACTFEFCLSYDCYSNTFQPLM